MTFEADYAMSFRSDEIAAIKAIAGPERDQAEKIFNRYFHWTGWTRRLWPAEHIRPGVRFYAFDKKSRRFVALLEVTRGGDFAYTTRESFCEEVFRLTGRRVKTDDPHYSRIPTWNRRRPNTGLTIRHTFVKHVDIPFDGRFPQIGWLDLRELEGRTERLSKLDTAGALHVLVGTGSGDPADLLQSERTTGSVPWAVPKNASPGDVAVIFVNGQGFIAYARLVSSPKPAKPGEYGPYRALLGEVARIEPPITIESIREALPSWKWATYPRSYATPPNEIADQLRRLVKAGEPDAEQSSDDDNCGSFTTDEYIQALRKIEPAISGIQRDMLLAHAIALGGVLTIPDLAWAVGNDDSHIVYSAYGKLGRMLGEALGEDVSDCPVLTRHIGRDTSDANNVVNWQMHPALIAALEQLQWRYSSAERDHPTRDDSPWAWDGRETTRPQRINARIGQTAFRRRLLMRWRKCPLTGIATESVLRASHIKPWHACQPRERHDPDNGILLAANFDALFDDGLISFSDVGQVLVSPALKTEERARLGLAGELSPIQFSPKQKSYLTYHRTHVFRRN